VINLTYEPGTPPPVTSLVQKYRGNSWSYVSREELLVDLAKLKTDSQPKPSREQGRNFVRRTEEPLSTANSKQDWHLANNKPRPCCH